MTEYTCDSFRFFNLFPVYFGGKGTSFLSAELAPVWPKPAPDRAEAGRSPTWGGNRPHGASWGRTGALVVLWGGWLWKVLPVPEGTQGAQNSARGERTGFAALAGGFPRVQGCKVLEGLLAQLHKM